VLCIKCQSGPTYLVRILTQSQETVNDLLTLGAYIYRKRHRVEPSRTQSPIPLLYEKCQSFNSHSTNNCPISLNVVTALALILPNNLIISNFLLSVPPVNNHTLLIVINFKHDLNQQSQTL